MRLLGSNLEVGGVVVVEDGDPPFLVTSWFVGLKDAVPHKCVHIYPIYDLGHFTCHRPSFLPPSLYVRPCPDTLPTNSREFTPGRPAHPSSLCTSMLFFSCPIIPPFPPTHKQHPCHGPIPASPYPAPMQPPLHWGSVAPVYLGKYQYVFRLPWMLITGQKTLKYFTRLRHIGMH